MLRKIVSLVAPVDGEHATVGLSEFNEAICRAIVLGEHGRAVPNPVSGGDVPEVITLEALSDERPAVVEQTPLQLQTDAPGETSARTWSGTRTSALRSEYTDERFSFTATDADQDVESVEHDAPPELQDAVERAAEACNRSFAAVHIRHDRETGDFAIIERNPDGRFAMAHEAGPLADWLVDGV
jgi:D-alanine-D-alanine ligase-like ATP-grasp enzyme